MSLLRSRGTIAGVLCFIVLGGIAVLWAVPSIPEGAKALGVLVLALLWVAAALLLTPFGRGGTLANAATLAYGLAFLLPAATARAPESDGVVWGFQAFVLGIGVVPAAWVANPVFVGALELRRRSDLRGARRLAFLAALLAATAPITLTSDLPVDVGFVVWAAAPLVLAIALSGASLPAAASRPAA